MAMVRVKGYTVKGGRKSTKHVVDSHYRHLNKDDKEKNDKDDRREYMTKKRKRNMFGL